MQEQILANAGKKYINSKEIFAKQIYVQGQTLANARTNIVNRDKYFLIQKKYLPKKYLRAGTDICKNERWTWPWAPWIQIKKCLQIQEKYCRDKYLQK